MKNLHPSLYISHSFYCSRSWPWFSWIKWEFHWRGINSYWTLRSQIYKTPYKKLTRFFWPPSFSMRIINPPTWTEWMNMDELGNDPKFDIGNYLCSKCKVFRGNITFVLVAGSPISRIRIFIRSLLHKFVSFRSMKHFYCFPLWQYDLVRWVGRSYIKVGRTSCSVFMLIY